MPHNRRYGDPRKRQAHIEQAAHHATSYLITWDMYVGKPPRIESSYMVVHSMRDVATAFGWICEQQENTRPENYADLPMPRVFPVDGAIRELPESGYDLIAPTAGTTYADPRIVGHG